MIYRLEAKQKTNGNSQFAMIVDGVLGALINRIVDLHNSGLITTPVTVIRGRKDSDNLSVMLPLVSLHH